MSKDTYFGIFRQNMVSLSSSSRDKNTMTSWPKTRDRQESVELVWRLEQLSTKDQSPSKTPTSPPDSSSSSTGHHQLPFEPFDCDQVILWQRRWCCWCCWWMRDRDGGSSSTSQNKHRSAHMDGWNDGLLISVGSVPNCNMLAVGISSSRRLLQSSRSFWKSKPRKRELMENRQLSDGCWWIWWKQNKCVPPHSR